jgi:hypothetical protein
VIVVNVIKNGEKSGQLLVAPHYSGGWDVQLANFGTNEILTGKIHQDIIRPGGNDWELIATALDHVGINPYSRLLKKPDVPTVEDGVISEADYY